MRRTVFAVVVALLVVPAWASDPGEPLDEGDFVIVLPGLNISVFASPTDCTPGEPTGFCDGASVDYVTPADGCVYRIRLVGLGRCAQGSSPTYFRSTLQRLCPGDSIEDVLFLEDRCNTDGTIDAGEIELLVSDLNGGTIAFRVLSKPRDVNLDPPRYNGVRRIDHLAGLATEFEILQTYTPPSGPVSFRVPYMPEGFQFADWFDSYYGTLATVGDWSQLQPLQCGYPTLQPSVGDYLTVADPLPTPTPGSGYYYVTAVNYMGDTRYGRRRSGGVLSGRDPAVLAGCSE